MISIFQHVSFPFHVNWRSLMNQITYLLNIEYDPSRTSRSVSHTRCFFYHLLLIIFEVFNIRRSSDIQSDLSRRVFYIFEHVVFLCILLLIINLNISTMSWKGEHDSDHNQYYDLLPLDVEVHITFPHARQLSKRIPHSSFLPLVSFRKRRVLYLYWYPFQSLARRLTVTIDLEHYFATCRRSTTTWNTSHQSSFLTFPQSINISFWSPSASTGWFFRRSRYFSNCSPNLFRWSSSILYLLFSVSRIDITSTDRIFKVEVNYPVTSDTASSERSTADTSTFSQRRDTLTSGSVPDLYWNSSSRNMCMSFESDFINLLFHFTTYWEGQDSVWWSAEAYIISWWLQIRLRNIN